MMNGLCSRMAAVVAGALALCSVARATVIQYQPTLNNERRGVAIGTEGEFTDALGLWVGQTSSGSQSASQTSLLGPQLMVAWNDVSGPTASSFVDVRFTVNNTTPFDLSASASNLGAFLVLRDLTTASNLALFFSTGQTSQTFSGELTGGHDFALTSTLRNPFGVPTASEFAFSVHQGGFTLVPGPGAAATLAAAGLLAGVRRRR